MSSRQWFLSLLILAPLASGCGGSDHPKNSPGFNPFAQAVPPAAATAKKTPAPGTVLYLHPWIEPKENAFSILIPRGWIAEGGVLRIDPRLGPTNSVGAKIDFSVKKDPAGSVMLHWFPNITYKDPRALNGMFRVGSNYMGSMVYPLLDPQTFLDRFIFRKQRPQAQNARISSARRFPNSPSGTSSARPCRTSTTRPAP